MLFDIPNKLFQEFSDSLKQNEGPPSTSQLRSLFESTLGKSWVTREEFDAQQAVLQRTRAKVDALEQQIAALEAQFAQGAKSPSEGTSNPSDG